MPGRKLLLLSIVCFWIFGLLIFLANHFYWSAAPTHPAGEYILFRRPLPTALGHTLWVGIKPLLLISPLAGAWFFYRFVRTWRESRRPGVCRVCGYDLRASPQRCPECGTSALS